MASSSSSLSGNYITLPPIQISNSELPSEVVYKIIDFLGEENSFNFSRASKLFHTIIEEYTFVYRQFVGLSTIPYVVHIPSKTGRNAKRLPIHKMLQIGVNIFKRTEIITSRARGESIQFSMPTFKRLQLWMHGQQFDHFQLDIKDADFKKIANGIINIDSLIKGNRLCEALLIAFSLGSQRMISLMINMLETPEVRGGALIHAVKNNNTEMVRSLLAENRQISLQMLQRALFEAAKNDYYDIVTYIIKGDPPILAGCRGSVLVFAAMHNRIETARYILHSEQPLFEDSKKNALICAASNCNLEMMALFEEYLEITDEWRANAVISASASGHCAAVAYLLRQENQQISIKNRGLAVKGAAEKGHNYVVEFLLPEDEQIDDGDRGLALVHAATQGNVEMMRFLAQDEQKICADDRGLAVFHAAQKGWTEAVRFLLERGQKIPEGYRAIALIRAQSNGYDDICEILSQ